MAELRDIGRIGLAVMGRDLSINMAEHGIHVAVHLRTTCRIEAFLPGPAGVSRTFCRQTGGETSIEQVRKALFALRVCSNARGFSG